MKVGTDGVLLGAWADLPNRGVCWDVGAGCGLISLMLAQRFEKMHFTAIEIDAPAAVQAKENVENTPFSDRIRVLNADFLDLTFAAASITAIVSNPPFFQETLHSPHRQRAQARHNAANVIIPMVVQMGFKEENITVKFRNDFGYGDIVRLLLGNTERRNDNE